MPFTFGAPLTILLFLLLCFCFLTIILIAFLVGTAEIYPGIVIEPVRGTGLKATGSDTSRS